MQAEKDQYWLEVRHIHLDLQALLKDPQMEIQGQLAGQDFKHPLTFDEDEIQAAGTQTTGAQAVGADQKAGQADSKQKADQANQPKPPALYALADMTLDAQGKPSYWILLNPDRLALTEDLRGQISSSLDKKELSFPTEGNRLFWYEAGNEEQKNAVLTVQPLDKVNGLSFLLSKADHVEKITLPGSGHDNQAQPLADAKTAGQAGANSATQNAGQDAAGKTPTGAKAQTVDQRVRGLSGQALLLQIPLQASQTLRQSDKDLTASFSAKNPAAKSAGTKAAQAPKDTNLFLTNALHVGMPGEDQLILVNGKESKSMSAKELGLEDLLEGLQEAVKADLSSLKAAAEGSANALEADGLLEDFSMDQLPLGQGPEAAQQPFEIKGKFMVSRDLLYGVSKPGDKHVLKLSPYLYKPEGQTIRSLTYGENSTVIATGAYDPETKTVTYTLTEAVKDLPATGYTMVDFDEIFYIDPKTTEVGRTYTLINSFDGRNLPSRTYTVMPGSATDPIGIEGETGEALPTYWFFDPLGTYKVKMEGHGDPVTEDGKLVAMDWTVSFQSTGKSLEELGLVTNFTVVEGSGLGKITDAKLNQAKISLSPNSLGDKFLITDSQSHGAGNYVAGSHQDSNNYAYTFRTEVTEKQTSYTLDIEAMLTKAGSNPKPVGASRLVVPGYSDAKNLGESPDVDYSNGRTTIKGSFNSANEARWVVTDGVTSGGAQALPFQERQLSGKQTLKSLNVTYYSLGEDGKLYEAGGNKSNKTSAYPLTTENLGWGAKNPGTIAVYEYVTELKDLSDPKSEYSLSGVTLDPLYGDILAQVRWQNISDKTANTPTNTLRLTPAGTQQAFEATIDAGTGYKNIFETVFHSVPRYQWVKNSLLGTDGRYIPTTYTFGQSFNPDYKEVPGATIRFKEVSHHFDPETGKLMVDNVAVREDQVNPQVPAEFIKIKKLAKKEHDYDLDKPLPGAVFTLKNADGAVLTAMTDENGLATFANVLPG